MGRNQTQNYTRKLIVFKRLPAKSSPDGTKRDIVDPASHPRCGAHEQPAPGYRYPHIPARHQQERLALYG